MTESDKMYLREFAKYTDVKIKGEIKPLAQLSDEELRTLKTTDKNVLNYASMRMLPPYEQKLEDLQCQKDLVNYELEVEFQKLREKLNE